MNIEKNDFAQMTLDYMVGIGIFMLSVTFLFQFMHGIFIPFQSTSDEVTLAADRTATILVERFLHADKSIFLSAVNQTKLYDFNKDIDYSNKTSYDNKRYELGLLGNQTYYNLNVTVQYYDSANYTTNLSGPPLPTNLDIAQTKRIILVINPKTGYSQEAIFSVRVW